MIAAGPHCEGVKHFVNTLTDELFLLSAKKGYERTPRRDTAEHPDTIAERGDVIEEDSSAKTRRSSLLAGRRASLSSRV